MYSAGLSGVRAESTSERPGQAQASPHTEERGVRSGKGKVLFPSQCWLSSYCLMTPPGLGLWPLCLRLYMGILTLPAPSLSSSSLEASTILRCFWGSSPC